MSARLSVYQYLIQYGYINTFSNIFCFSNNYSCGLLLRKHKLHGADAGEMYTLQVIRIHRRNLEKVIEV